jgi:hypothetical protein
LVVVVSEGEVASVPGDNEVGHQRIPRDVTTLVGVLADSANGVSIV